MAVVREHNQTARMDLWRKGGAEATLCSPSGSPAAGKARVHMALLRPE